MKIRFIQLNDYVLKIESNANDSQWNKLVRFIFKNTDKNLISVIKELKNFDYLEIKIIP